MSTKKVKVKVKKKKLKVKNILIFLTILVILILSFIYLKELPITNIYIINNKNISDKEIMKLAKIDKYPSFVKSFKYEMKKNILKNKYIKEVKINKTFERKVYIEISEYKTLCQIKGTNDIILENGVVLENVYEETEVPLLINDITEIKEDFVKAFNKVNTSIMLKISEIEYSPVEVDKERFILYMNDDNLVYITLSKIDSLNKYNEIEQELEGKKGILYLDSGNYFEERK